MDAQKAKEILKAVAERRQIAIKAGVETFFLQLCDLAEWQAQEIERLEAAARSNDP